MGKIVYQLCLGLRSTKGTHRPERDDDDDDDLWLVNWHSFVRGTVNWMNKWCEGTHATHAVRRGLTDDILSVFSLGEIIFFFLFPLIKSESIPHKG